MPMKQRLDVTDPSDTPSFLAKEMDYGFQERNTNISKILIVLISLCLTTKMFTPEKYFSYTIRC